MNSWLIAVLMLVSVPACALSQTDSTGAPATRNGQIGAPGNNVVNQHTLPHTDSSSISVPRLAIVGGVLLGGITAIHIYQMNGWWKDNRTSFHFREDLVYGLNVDKLGHIYGGDVLTFIFSKSLRWANFPELSALWWGAGASLLFQTYVEVEDGFSTWGFDRVDWASDVTGAFYPVAQHYVPILQNLDMKFSYHPSDLLDSGAGVGFRGQKHIMFDDYEGQTIWFSFKVHNLLPEAARSYWPGWLCLALGYGARDVGGVHPHRVYFLALDLDLTRVLPKDSEFLQTLGEAFNHIHLPLPAVRFEPGTIWYGLYF